MDNKNREQKSSRSTKGDNFNRKPKDGSTSAKIASAPKEQQQPLMSPRRANNTNKDGSSSQSKFNRILGNLERTILNQFSSHNGNRSNNNNVNDVDSKHQQKKYNLSAPQAATTTNNSAAAVLANAAAMVAAQQQNKQLLLKKDEQLNIMKSNHHQASATPTENQNHKGIKLQQQPLSTTTKTDDGQANNKKSKITLNKYQQQIVSTLRLPNRHLHNSDNNNGTQQPIVAVGVSTKLSIPPPHANDEARSSRLLFGSTTTTKPDTSNSDCYNNDANVNNKKLQSLDRLATSSSPASSAKSLPTIGINQKVLLSDRSQNYNNDEKRSKNKCLISNNNIDIEEESGFSTYQSRRSLGLSTTTTGTGVNSNNNSNNNITGVTNGRQTDQPKQTLEGIQSNKNNTMNNNMIIMPTSQLPIGATINFNLTNHHQQQQPPPPPAPFRQQHISHHHLQNLHQQQQNFISYSNYLQQHHEQNINTQLQNHNQILSNQVPIMSQHNSLTNSSNSSFYTPSSNSHDLYNNSNNFYGQQPQNATSAGLTTMPPSLPLPPPPPLPPNQAGQIFNPRLMDNHQQQQIYANAPPKPRRYQYYDPNSTSNSNTNQLIIQQQQNLYLQQQRQQQPFNVITRATLPIQKPQPPPPPSGYNLSYLNRPRQSPDLVQNSLYQQQQNNYFPPLIKSKSSLDACDLIGLKQHHQQQDNYNVNLHSNHNQQRAPIYGSQIMNENSCRYPSFSSMTLRPSYSSHQNNQQFATAFNNLIAHQQQAHDRATNLQRSKSVTHLLHSSDYELNHQLEQQRQLLQLQHEPSTMFSTNALNNNNPLNNKKFLNSSSLSTTNLNYYGLSNTNQHQQKVGHQIDSGNGLNNFSTPSSSLVEPGKFSSSQITRINTNNKNIANWTCVNNNDSVQIRQQQRPNASNWIAVTSNPQMVMTTAAITSSNVSVVTTPATSTTTTTTTTNNNNRAINFSNNNNNSKLVRQTQQGEHNFLPASQSHLQEDGFNNNNTNNNLANKPSLDDKIRFLLIENDDKQGEQQQDSTLSNNIYHNQVNGRPQVSIPSNTIESNNNNSGSANMKHAENANNNNNNSSSQLFKSNQIISSSPKDAKLNDNINLLNIQTPSTSTLIDSNNQQRIYINDSALQQPLFKSSQINGNSTMGNRHNHNGKNSYDVSAEMSLHQQNSTLVVGNNNANKETSNSHLIVDLTTPRVLAKTQTNLMAAAASPAISTAASRPSSWSINQLGLPEMNSTTTKSSNNNNNNPNDQLKTVSKISPSSASYGNIQSSFDSNQTTTKNLFDNHQRSAPYYYSDLKSKEQQMALLSIVQQKSLSPPPQLLSRSTDQSNTRLAPRSATMHANQAKALSENFAAKQQYNLLRHLNSANISRQNDSNSSLINRNIDKLFEDKTPSYNDNREQSQIVHSMLDLNDCKDSNEVVSCLTSFPLQNNQKQNFLSRFYESSNLSNDYSRNIKLNDNNQQAQMSSATTASSTKQALFNKSKSLENIAQKSSPLQVNDQDLIVVNYYKSRNPVYENIKRSDKLINAINNSTTCLSSLTSRNNNQRLNNITIKSQTKQQSSANSNHQARHLSSDESMDSTLATDDDEENISSDDNVNSSTNSLNLIDEINISPPSDNHLSDIIKLIEQLKLNHSKLAEEYRSTLIKIANIINNNNSNSHKSSRNKRSHQDDKRKEEKLARRLQLLELKSKKCESRSKNQLALIQMMEKVLKQQSKIRQHDEQDAKKKKIFENNNVPNSLSPVIDKDSKQPKPIIKAIVTENDTKTNNSSKIVEVKKASEDTLQVSNANRTNTKAKTNAAVVSQKVMNFERRQNNDKNPFNSTQNDDQEKEVDHSDEETEEEDELDEIKKQQKRELLNFKDDEDFIEFLSTDNSSHRSSQFEASQFSVSDFNTSTSSNQSESSAGCCNDSLNSPIISTKSPQQQQKQTSANSNQTNGSFNTSSTGSILKNRNKVHEIETDNEQQLTFKLKDNHSEIINNNNNNINNNNDDSTGRLSTDSFSVLNTNNSNSSNRFNNVLGNVIDVDVCSLNNMSQCSPPVNRNHIHHHKSPSVLN